MRRAFRGAVRSAEGRGGEHLRASEEAWAGAWRGDGMKAASRSQFLKVWQTPLAVAFGTRMCNFLEFLTAARCRWVFSFS